MDTTSSRSDLTPGTCVPKDIFVTTQWTVVLAAGDRSTRQSERALEAICRTYWFPLYAYVRRRGHSKEDAEDLTQEFFRQLLEHRWIEKANREKGRLRAFLITALKRFMAKEWRKASAGKRGGGIPCLSIDADLAESRYASSSNTPRLDAEALFDRQWAMTVLEQTLKRLESEQNAAGRSDAYAVLKDVLALNRDAIDYAQIAKALKTSEGAVRTATHRLRKRFRELYREEIAGTLPPDADLDEEARYLAESLAKE